MGPYKIKALLFFIFHDEHTKLSDLKTLLQF